MIRVSQKKEGELWDPFHDTDEEESMDAYDKDGVRDEIEPVKKRPHYPQGNYDEKVPIVLKREQQWFGMIIGRPIDQDSRMNPISPTGQSMEEEAALHIAPSPTLRPAQRIQIYNQQYWWRLLNTLHESFPLVTRLFGYFDFNRLIGIPYLTKYPSRHWSLSFLGDRLSQWCQEDYQARDQELVRHSIEVDWAFAYSFLAPLVSSLTPEQFSSEKEAEAIASKTLCLQSCIFLFEFPYDLFKFRVEFLQQEPDYWLHHDFPSLDSSKPYYYILFRNQDNDIAWKGLTQSEYLILKRFQAGSSIDSVCEWLEDQEEEIHQAATAHLQAWFREWTHRGWLCI